MGFLSGLLDFLVGVANEGAKIIDKKSDDELEDMSFNKVLKSGDINDYKTADEYRDFANKAHELHEQRKNKK